MKIGKYLFISVFVLVLANQASLASSPLFKIFYQGRFLAKPNCPVATTETVSFKIFDAEKDGKILWETKTASVCSNCQGYFAVIVESGDNFPKDRLLNREETYFEALISDKVQTRIKISDMLNSYGNGGTPEGPMLIKIVADDIIVGSSDQVQILPDMSVQGIISNSANKAIETQIPLGKITKVMNFLPDQISGKKGFNIIGLFSGLIAIMFFGFIGTNYIRIKKIK